MPETLCSRLADLKTRLEADFFHIIGMGPAYGECIALRIPPKLWVAVDSFHMNGNQSPLRELLAGEEVSGLILTHPHDDHAPGLDQLIEDHPNAWVGCAAAWLDDWMDIDLMDAEAVQNSGASTHSLAALRRRWLPRDGAETQLVTEFHGSLPDVVGDGLGGLVALSPRGQLVTSSFQGLVPFGRGHFVQLLRNAPSSIPEARRPK